jgi:hypothetical protein
LNKYDEQGCNQFTGCIPECVYADGRLDLSELERIKNEIKHADVKGTEAEDDSNNISPMSDKTRLE